MTASSLGPAPRTIGGYTLLAKLGEGGMGIVHLARRDADGERVALKMLRPHIVGDEEARARLAREVASLSRIRSRWVAEIVDADPWAEVPFIATRYVPGLSLHEYVAEDGPITGRDLTWFAACLAEGVATVHSVGVLHRDVKPANVLMEGRTPILIDFGLARVADDPRLTHTGWLLGTPGYLAPEILYGDDATAASDVHSWAATVAYAATGRPPFGRGPSMAIMDRVRRGQFDLTGVPEELGRLLAAALHPDPAQRPALESILDWLRPQVRPRRPTTPPPPVPHTMPFSAAPRDVEAPDRPTDVLTDDATVVDGADAVEPAADEELFTDWSEAWEPLPPRTTWGERLRRSLLLLLAVGVVAAGVAAYPWISLAVLVTGVWLLRSGSLAASAAGERRRLRGRRWYDAPLVVLRSPWDLVRSVPGSVLLVLWSAGLAFAAALVCYAFVASEEVTLAVCGGVFAFGLWTGPGGSRVRSPLRRAVRPAARRWQVWVAAVVLLGIVGAGLGALVESQGTDWKPALDRPLAGRF